MPRQAKATFAVGIFAALESLRTALIDLVSLGYQQRHLILLHGDALASDRSEVSADDILEPPVSVKKLVTPVRGRLDPSKQSVLEQVSFEVHHDPQDAQENVSLVLDLQDWLSPRHYDTLIEALRDSHSVLFVRMCEQRQVAPTCSILLSHCTQHVNTHEVALKDGRPH